MNNNPSKMFLLGVVLFLALNYFNVYLAAVLTNILGTVFTSTIDVGFGLSFQRILSSVISFVFFVVVLFFLFRKDRYLGLGFLLSIPASLLFAALIVVELALHPPNEE